MGVADNITYKQMYHFRDSFRDDFHAKGKSMPSINSDPAINTTIKKNPYASNVEIEGDEVVLQPDLSALFNAKGPKHKNGGMDVLLRPDSFVFSDDKSLALGKNDHDLLELKTGGNFNPRSNTPADVLKRNVPLKDYNSLVTNLDDKNKDFLAKKSSAMMLEKYMKSLGNIAYAQELKKGFPDGLPSFSQGTAPIADKSVEGNIEAQKQYAKYGGKIGNPFMQMGGSSHSRGRYAFNPILDNGRIPSPTLGNSMDRYSGKYPPYPNAWTNYYDKSQRRQYTAPDWITPQEFYSTPGVVDYMKTLDHMNGVDNDLHKPDDAQWGYRHQAALEKFFPNGNNVKLPPFPMADAPIPNVTDAPAPTSDDTITPNSITGKPQGIKQANWQFTPWQKLSQLYNWGQYANVKRYMPYRSHYNATYVDSALVNPEQTIADMRGTTNQQLQSLSTLNPILRNAQASSAFGQLLNQMPSVRSNYDNQNSQILNQTRQYNNQIKNQESMLNMQNDQNYYKESVIGRQNFDNMRQFTANNAMNNTMRDVETNQRLAYNLMTVDNPAYGFNFRTGNFYRNPKDIRDVQGMLPQNSLQGMLDYAKQLKDSGLEPSVQSALLRGTLFKQIAPYFQQAQANPYGYPFSQSGYGTGYGYKKGGKIKNPYRY